MKLNFNLYTYCSHNSSHIAIEIIELRLCHLPYSSLDKERRYYIKMKDDDETFRVRTIPDKPPQPKETDISKMNEDDLEQLKRNDPFLYNSIPSINKAKLTNETVDHSKVIRDAVSQPSSAVVSRKSRVSTESAASVMVDEYLSR